MPQAWTSRLTGSCLSLHLSLSRDIRYQLHSHQHGPQARLGAPRSAHVRPERKDGRAAADRFARVGQDVVDRERALVEDGARRDCSCPVGQEGRAAAGQGVEGPRGAEKARRGSQEA